MPLGFAGFPRDPTTGKATGTAQSFLSSKFKSSKDSSKSKSTSTSAAAAKAKEGEATAHRESTDTLPAYSENPSTASQAETQRSSMTSEQQKGDRPEYEAADQSQPRSPKSPKSSMARAFDKVRSKAGRKGKGQEGAEALAGNEEEFESMKAKEQEKENRKEDYDKLELNKRTKYGMGRGGMSFG